MLKACNHTLGSREEAIVKHHEADWEGSLEIGSRYSYEGISSICVNPNFAHFRDFRQNCANLLTNHHGAKMVDFMLSQYKVNQLGWQKLMHVNLQLIPKTEKIVNSHTQIIWISPISFCYLVIRLDTIVSFAL